LRLNDTRKDPIHLAAHQRRGARNAALVRHVRHVDASGLPQHLQRDVIDRAGSARSRVQLPGTLPREGDQFPDRSRWHGGVHDEKLGGGGNLPDRREILQRIECHLLVNGRGNGDL
jgi:hypothetical protein